MRTKLLVIGLDAANSSLVRDWAAAGILPNIAALMQRGRTAVVRGVDGFFTGSTWPTLLSGTSPARHGIHYLVQLRPGTYSFTRPHQGEYIRAPMFWEELSRAGKRVAILDAPLSKLDPAIRGIQTVEWAGHDSIFGFKTAPAGLAAEILHAHGRHPVPSDCDAAARTQEDFRRFVETLIRGVEAKARLTCDLLERGPWDLFLQVFTETHCVGHQCWHLHDPTHPAHDVGFRAEYGDPVQRVYKAVDAAIGEVLAGAGNPAVMLIVSHGMAHSLAAHRLLPDILCRLGLSVPQPPGPRRRDPSYVAQALARRLPRSTQGWAQRLLSRPAVPGSFELPTIDVDTKASRCFVVPNGLAVSGIRLNLKGREPDGMVARGETADRLVRDLAGDLLEILDLGTGLPLVKRVMRTAEMYDGPWLDLLPDVLVEWEDTGPCGSTVVGPGICSTVRAQSPKIGTLEAVNSYGRTGEHRADGLLIAAGPHQAANDQDSTISILDVAPTIAGALGVSLSLAEGRPIASMVPGSVVSAGS